MKYLLVLLLIINTSWAKLPKVFGEVDQRLSALLEKHDGDFTLEQMKNFSVDQNIDLDVAYENYFQAKREVNIARAEFNPLTTGHLLGMSLGVNYLWTPIAIEAVLAIPTKFYTVKSKKYFRRANFYNYIQMQEVIKNDMAHFYYDILVHKMILDTLDLEMELINEFYATHEAKSNELRKRIARLSLERNGILSLYVKEMEGFNNLLAITFNAQMSSLAPINKSITSAQVKAMRPLFEELDDLVKKSPLYLAAINNELAARANLKSVKWSIITFRGFNFSYRRRVRQAKSSYRREITRKVSTINKLKAGVLSAYGKLQTTTNLSEHYASIYNTSKLIYKELVDKNAFGLTDDDTLLGMSLDLIRDYRDYVLANYKSWSALDDFAKASVHQIKLEASGAVVAEQEVNPRLRLCQRLTADDFSVEWDHDAFDEDSTSEVTVELKSEYNDLVKSVTYKFDDRDLRTKIVSSARYNFRASQFSLFGDRNFLDGVVIITLKNNKKITKEFHL